MKALKYCPNCFSNMELSNYPLSGYGMTCSKKWSNCWSCQTSISFPLDEDSPLHEYFTSEVVKKHLKKKLQKQMEKTIEKNLEQERRLMAEIDSVSDTPNAMFLEYDDKTN